MTEEERERIYEEEKAREEARLRLEQEKKVAEAATAAKPNGGGGCAGIGCLGLLIFFIFIALFSGSVSHTDEYGIDKRDPDYKVLRDFVDGKGSR